MDNRERSKSLNWPSDERKRVCKYLRRSGGSIPTRALKLQLEDIPIDDGTIYEIKRSRIKPNESPRVVAEKRSVITTFH